MLNELLGGDEVGAVEVVEEEESDGFVVSPRCRYTLATLICPKLFDELSANDQRFFQNPPSAVCEDVHPSPSTSLAMRGKGKGKEVEGQAVIVSPTGKVIGTQGGAGEESLASPKTPRTPRSDKGKGKASTVSVTSCGTGVADSSDCRDRR